MTFLEKTYKHSSGKHNMQSFCMIISGQQSFLSLGQP